METKLFDIKVSRIKVCRRCGKEFVAFRLDQKECGCKLIKPGELQIRKCGFCGKEFQPKRRGSRLCSRDCSKKEDYAKHKDRVKNKSHEWYKNNLARATEKRKEKYWSNPEKFREQTREYYKQHKEEKRKADEVYKDKVRHGGLKEELVKKNGLVCSKCGKEGDSFQIVAHHQTFVKTEHDKQELLCRSCHARIHCSGRLMVDLSKEKLQEALGWKLSLEETARRLNISRWALFERRKLYGFL